MGWRLGSRLLVAAEALRQLSLLAPPGDGDGITLPGVHAEIYHTRRLSPDEQWYAFGKRPTNAWVFSANDLETGQKIEFEKKYKGRVLLIANTASF